MTSSPQSPNSDSSRNLLKYSGQNYQFLPTYRRNRAPDHNDLRDPLNQGYYPVPSIWIDTSDLNVYILVKAEALRNGGALWVLFSTAAGDLLNIQVDTNGLGINNPVVPTAAGTISLTGNQVGPGVVGLDVIRSNTSAEHIITLEIQDSSSAAVSTPALNGVSHFDSAQFGVDPNGFVTLAAGIPLVDLHTALYIVSSAGVGSGTGANYTTIATAITAAVASGINSTIFIMPGLTGVYTENLTLPPGIDLVAFDADALTPNVTISGTITCTGSGSNSISGIRLQTNSAPFLTVSGSAATVVNLKSCYLNCLNNTGISYTSSSASSLIQITDCRGNLATTGIALWNSTSAGMIRADYTYMNNTGKSTTISSNSAGGSNLYFCDFGISVGSTGAGLIGVQDSVVDLANTGTQATGLTVNGSGAAFSVSSYFSSGTASAISIGSLGNLILVNGAVNSSNTNAITGSAGGVLNIGGTIFNGTSSLINAALTITGYPLSTLQGGTGLTASGTVGNVLTSNGTIWTSTAPATSGTVTSVSGTANQVSVATGTTTPVISLIGPYTPANYTAHGVLIGEGTSSIAATAVGTTGQVLTGVTGEDPVWAAPAASGIQTITGNTGGAESPSAGNFNFLTANTTVKFAGTANTETLNFGLTNLIIGSSSTSINFATSNVGLGEGSLNSLTSGENNVCVGFNSGNATSTGINNVSIGNDALLLMTGSVQNVAVGASALNTLQVSTGSNTGIGYNALGGITTGTQNTALGVNAGSTYGTSESSNIVIGNTGTLSESNTIRIGVNGSSAGQQNRAFIAGITGVTVVGPLVNISSTGQLGALANGTTGQVLTGSTGASPVWAAPATSGTVTSVSVVSANGFAGTVATATTTPAITLSTTITGILQGNGTAISAASTNGSGNIVLTTSPTLVTPVLGVAAATSVSFPSAGGTGTATSDIQSYYEEGTWVPTAVGGTTAGTTTYTTQVGAYIRIGSCVHVIGTFTYSAATGTGIITLGGLPFTIKNTSNLLPTGSAVTSSSTITWPVGTTSLAIQGLVNTTTAKFACCGTGVGDASVQMANAGTTFNFSFFYFV
jgi:hypothetical protein